MESCFGTVSGPRGPRGETWCLDCVVLPGTLAPGVITRCSLVVLPAPPHGAVLHRPFLNFEKE